MKLKCGAHIRYDGENYNCSKDFGHEGEHCDDTTAVGPVCRPRYDSQLAIYIRFQGEVPPTPDECKCAMRAAQRELGWTLGAYWEVGNVSR